METPDLLEYEKQAIRDLVDALPELNLPWRQPSFNDPTFWSRPLNETAIRPIDGSSGWETLLDIKGSTAYTACVEQYVAAPFGSALLADMDFRFVLNGSLVSTMSLQNGIEFHKTGPSTFPCVPRRTFFTLRFFDRLQLQVRNNSATAQYAIGAFYGWYFNDTNPNERNVREGITDV